jgi:hypothetical protein
VLANAFGTVLGNGLASSIAGQQERALEEASWNVHDADDAHTGRAMQEMLARSMVETTYGAAGGLKGRSGAAAMHGGGIDPVHANGFQYDVGDIHLPGFEVPDASTLGYRAFGIDDDTFGFDPGLRGRFLGDLNRGPTHLRAYDPEESFLHGTSTGRPLGFERLGNGAERWHYLNGYVEGMTGEDGTLIDSWFHRGALSPHTPLLPAAVSGLFGRAQYLIENALDAGDEFEQLSGYLGQSTLALMKGDTGVAQNWLNSEMNGHGYAPRVLSRIRYLSSIVDPTNPNLNLPDPAQVLGDFTVTGMSGGLGGVVGGYAMALGFASRGLALAGPAARLGTIGVVGGMTADITAQTAEHVHRDARRAPP